MRIASLFFGVLTSLLFLTVCAVAQNNNDPFCNDNEQFTKLSCNGGTVGIDGGTPRGGTIQDPIVSKNQWVRNSFVAEQSFTNIGFKAIFDVVHGEVPMDGHVGIFQPQIFGDVNLGEWTVTFQSQFLFQNNAGYDVYEVWVYGVDVKLEKGDYWLVLKDVRTQNEKIVVWEENDGKG